MEMIDGSSMGKSNDSNFRRLIINRVLEIAEEEKSWGRTKLSEQLVICAYPKKRENKAFVDEEVAGIVNTVNGLLSKYKKGRLESAVTLSRNTYLFRLFSIYIYFNDRKYFLNSLCVIRLKKLASSHLDLSGRNEESRIPRIPLFQDDAFFNATFSNIDSKEYIRFYEWEDSSQFVMLVKKVEGDCDNANILGLGIVVLEERRSVLYIFREYDKALDIFLFSLNRSRQLFVQIEHIEINLLKLGSSEKSNVYKYVGRKEISPSSLSYMDVYNERLQRIRRTIEQN